MAQGSRSFDDARIGLFDLSHDSFCIAGFDGYLKRANPAFARSLGYTLDELLARPFMANVYPDDVKSVETVLAALAAGTKLAGAVRIFEQERDFIGAHRAQKVQ